MDNLVWIISTIIIIVILSLVFKELYSQRKPNNTTNIIRPKKIFFFVGCICSVGILSLVIFAWFLETSSSKLEKILFASLIIFIFVILLGGYLIFFYLNYKIAVYDDYFVYQNFWRVKKKIYYKDIVINKEKLYPQIRLKKDNGKTKLVFKLAGILDNEEIFMETYKKWKNSEKSKTNKNQE